MSNSSNSLPTIVTYTLTPMSPPPSRDSDFKQYYTANKDAIGLLTTVDIENIKDEQLKVLLRGLKDYYNIELKAPYHYQRIYYTIVELLEFFRFNKMAVEKNFSTDRVKVYNAEKGMKAGTRRRKYKHSSRACKPRRIRKTRR